MIWITAATLLVAACTFQSKWYHQYRATPQHGWNKKDTLCFEPDSVPQDGKYAVFLEMRTRYNYPYRNLWLTLERTAPNGQRLTCDTVQWMLGDNNENTGVYGINCKQYVLPLDTCSWQQGEHIYMRIYHIMRRENLPGIIDVGLRIEQL